jgi:hypothetical protein
MMISKKLSKVGVPATAKIMELRDTGVTVNNSPQIKLLLEVNSPMGGTYLVETKQIISRLQTSSFQPGAVIPVIVDPNDKNMIALDYGNGSNASSNSSVSSFNNPTSVLTGPWAGIDQEEALKRLVSFDNTNKEILAIGRSSRAIVSKYTWLGIDVNGENPAVELSLEVLPDDRPAFTAVTYCVIKQESVQKFQAGEEIYVKYDPNDVKRVTVEHS